MDCREPLAARNRCQPKKTWAIWVTFLPKLPKFGGWHLFDGTFFDLVCGGG
jgi:hypothetical protein